MTRPVPSPSTPNGAPRPPAIAPERSPGSEVTDRSLVDDFVRTRDELAFRRLYRRHTPLLFGMALRLTGGAGDRAADLVEDTWVRAVDGLTRFGWKSQLSTWLGGILVNCHREHTRRAAAAPESIESIPDPPARPDRPEARIDLENALARLPAGYREVVTLFHIYGYSHREIAELLQVEEGTSKSQLARGRQRLKELLT